MPEYLNGRDVILRKMYNAIEAFESR